MNPGPSPSMDRYQLEFFRHLHRLEGVNYTVRLGDKWAKRLKPGDQVWISNNGGPHLRRFEATVTDVWHGVLLDLPQYVLDGNHDGAITWPLMIDRLRESYPGLSWDINQTRVVAIGYRLVPASVGVNDQAVIR